MTQPVSIEWDESSWTGEAEVRERGAPDLLSGFQLAVQQARLHGYARMLDTAGNTIAVVSLLAENLVLTEMASCPETLTPTAAAECLRLGLRFKVISRTKFAPSDVPAES